MPLLGAHISVSGGVSNALEIGAKLRCDAIQIFVKSNVQWKSAPLTAKEQERFLEIKKKSPIRICFAHACYLNNLATQNCSIFDKSIECLTEEFDRCRRLGLSYLILHPGSHRGAGMDNGINRVVEGIDTVLKSFQTTDIKILLETTAGQGDYLGGRFEHLAEIIERSRYTKRLGICLDTCHVFAAGYDMHNKRSYNNVIKEFDSIIGLERLMVIHLNDSKGKYGSHTDRHTHIGKGEIGLDTFRLILNDRRLEHLPMIIETPKEDDIRNDRRNLRILRSLIANSKK